MSQMTSQGSVPTGVSGPGGDTSTLEQGTRAVQQHGGAALGAAKEEAGQVVQSAQRHAMDALGTVGDELRGQSEQQAERIAASLSQAAEELRGFSDGGQGAPMLGGIARTLATTAERWSDRLAEGGAEGVLKDTASYGREHPGRFVAIAASAGFVLGRLVRSADTSTLRDAVTGGGDGGADGARDDGRDDPAGVPAMPGAMDPGAAVPGAGASLGQGANDPATTGLQP